MIPGTNPYLSVFIRGLDEWLRLGAPDVVCASLRQRLGFGKIRLCSLMFTYIRLTGKKEGHLRKGRSEKAECRMPEFRSRQEAPTGEGGS